MDPVDVPNRLDGRCGTCARFVRVIESIDQNGEVKRAGQCLLGVWPAPLYETNTCSQYVKRGTFKDSIPQARNRHKSLRRKSPRDSGGAQRGAPEPFNFTLPEEILEMDADEFRSILRDVIRDELGASSVDIAGKWEGGELILKAGKEGVADKHIPIESLFHKIVMLRDKLRVLEQKLNSHPKLSAEEKVQMQQYVTQCYGTLTTFNVLFASREDGFIGQKGDKE
ncbi:MAG: hypothetical protein ABI461_16315 [Polyangiaceae bacterium]